MKELTTEEQIEVAINDVKNAMLENMNADRAEIQAKDQKKKARYALQQANARLRGLQDDIYSISLESINKVE